MGKKYDDEKIKAEAEKKKAEKLAARQKAKDERRAKRENKNTSGLFGQMEAARTGAASDIVARAKARARAQSSNSPRHSALPRRSSNGKTLNVAAAAVVAASERQQRKGRTRRGMRRGVRRKRP